MTAGMTPLMAAAVYGLMALGAVLLALMPVVARRARRDWELRMAEIERKHSGLLCRDLARFARGRMRTRHILRLIRGGPDGRGGSRDDEPT